MSGFTPGPWRAEMYAQGWAVSANHIAGRGMIFHVVERVGGDHRQEPKNGTPEANARLIAAAPALVEALKPFARMLTQHHSDLPDGFILHGVTGHTITAGDLRRAVAALRAAGWSCESVFLIRRMLSHAVTQSGYAARFLSHVVSCCRMLSHSQVWGEVWGDNCTG